VSARDLVGVVLLGAAAYGLLRRSAVTTLPPTLLTPPTALPGAPVAPSDYRASTVARESGGDPNAKNPRSSASGLYQFTKATWRRLGGQWGPDDSKPFGGLAVSVAEQTARFNQLTGGNAGALQRAGIAITNATLYAAHFLGSPTAVRVLRAPASASLAALVGSKVMQQNPQLAGFTVGDFRRWLEAKA
jgi:hypothetical protein